MDCVKDSPSERIWLWVCGQSGCTCGRRHGQLIFPRRPDFLAPCHFSIDQAGQVSYWATSRKSVTKYSVSPKQLVGKPLCCS